MSKFDPRKPVQTRSGKPVTLVLLNARGMYPLRGYIGGDDLLRGWEASGSYVSDNFHTEADLVNVPVKKEIWMNIYPNHSVSHASRKEADFHCSSDRVACVRVEYTEGEGL